MLCRNPYMFGSIPCGCGRCIPCVTKIRRLWSRRLVLESILHEESTFITLTYAPTNVPTNGTLAPWHTRDFLKRLRRQVEPKKLRYFLSGEYGDSSERPHYHVALFGYPNCLRGRSQFVDTDSVPTCCPPCDQIRSSWGFGNVVLGSLTPASASYVAGYVTKKIGGKIDYGYRVPEFRRMSLRPGIGAGFAKKIADSISLYPDIKGRIASDFQLPDSLKAPGGKGTIGRYLRDKVIAALSLDLADFTRQRIQSAEEELFRMQKEDVLAAKAASQDSIDAWQLHKDRMNQRIKNFEARYRVYDKKGVL